MINAETIADAENLSPDLIVDLDRMYSKHVMNVPRDDRGGVFHPSAIDMCGRRSVYEYLRYPKENHFEEEDLEIFAMGHAVHDLVQETIANLSETLEKDGYGIEFSPELKRPDIDPLYDDLGCGGTTDGLIRIYRLDGSWAQRSILEVKSMKDNLWEKLRSPKIGHRMQAHLYALRFDCPIIYYWYYNKNTSRRKVYSEVFDSEIADEALNRLGTWKEYADRKELPPREESWYMCPRCAYKDHCNPPTVRKQRSKTSTKAIEDARKSGLFGGSLRKVKK